MDFFFNQGTLAVNMWYFLQTHIQIKVCERFPGWKPCASLLIGVHISLKFQKQRTSEGVAGRK